MQRSRIFHLAATMLKRRMHRNLCVEYRTGNVEFAYADQDTAVIEKEISVTDERQKVSITVEKQDAGDRQYSSRSSVRYLQCKKDIQTKDGKVIVKSGYSFTENDF